MTAENLSVIIPLAPGEPAPRKLLAQLAESDAEILVSAVDERPAELLDNVAWLTGPAGRGCQLNTGAGQARADWLWFVHADSRLCCDTLTAVERFIRRGQAAIGYCSLRFLDDGPFLTRLNALGASLRSRFLGLPYGDQGLCMPAQAFERLRGFREDLERGEDLDFVVRARQAGLRAHPVGAAIETSGRRYREQGWLATTWHHQIDAWRLVRNARRTSRSNSA